MSGIFKCEFPKCGFSTSVRSDIDKHHIIPKSMPGSSNKGSNLIYLCPSCHRSVYVPGIAGGHHAIKKENSIEIIGKRDTTKGTCLEYKQVSTGKTFFYFYRDGDVWEN